MLLLLVPLIPPRRVGGFKNFKVFTDFSYLVKFSVVVAVAVTFINLCADAFHVVGDVVIIFIIICRCHLFDNIDKVVVVTNTFDNVKKDKFALFD